MGLEAAALYFGQRFGRSTARQVMKLFNENISGRCLVFSCELAKDGVVIASKDFPSDCLVAQRTELL